MSSCSSARALIGDTVNSNNLTINTNQVKCWFLRRGETGVPGENVPLGAEQRTNKLNPHKTPYLGIEPGPDWWEASALTTAPSLHPNKDRFLPENAGFVSNAITESMTLSKL